jgi:tetratricopeptide (TPR) repeat protein
MTQNNLGAAWWDLPLGDRGENLREAIACYQRALEVYTSEAYPRDSAMTQNNLGLVWADLPVGDREENLRHAIACYERTLEVHTREAYPRDWATTQHNLGNAWADLPGGAREENLRQAIACYQRALEVYTLEADPREWRLTQNNLGNAWRNLSSGDWGKNQRRAIACYQRARVFTEEADSHPQAGSRSALGRSRISISTGSVWTTMQNNISRTLALVVQMSGLAEEGPVDFHSVREATQHLASVCSEGESEQLSLESRLLQDRAAEMEASPGASAALKFFIQLDSTMLQIENDMAGSVFARAWWTGQRLAEVASAIEKFDAESDSQWQNFPETVCCLGAMRSGMHELSEFLALPVSEEIGGFDQLLELLKTSQEKLNTEVAAGLCSTIWHTRPKMDRQMQNLWYLTHGARVFKPSYLDASDQTDVDDAEAYAWMWNDLLINARIFVTPEICNAAAERARTTASNAGLDDVAEWVSDSKRLMSYGLSNILPPAPMPWRLSSAVEIETFLKNELARWYFRPYRFELQPLDLIEAVVRLRRPLYYERLLAHSLLQFHLLQTCLSAEVEAGYLNVLVTLAKSIDVFLAGYQLRIASIPKLKGVAGWAEYLESLVRIHSENPRTLAWTPLSRSLPFSPASYRKLPDARRIA